MNELSRPSIAALRKRADVLFDALAVKFPSEVEDLRSLLELIRRREEATTNDFDTVRSPREAIALCLTERGGWMSKQQIFDRLIAGGFYQDLSAQKWLMNDNIRNGLRSGRLVQHGKENGWETLIGLPHFK